MKPSHVFVSIEGVDGVGKTTVAKLLAADGSFQYHKSPSGHFAQLRKEVDIHATPIERYCFYHVSNQFDSIQVCRLLKKRAVVCDRYTASTVAYHTVMDSRIRDIHHNDGLLKPNFAFLLGARPEVRDKRIHDRSRIVSDSALERDGNFLNQVAEVFMSLNLIYIDTSDITVEEVVAKIRHIATQGRAT